MKVTTEDRFEATGVLWSLSLVVWMAGMVALGGCTMLYPCGAEDREFCVGDDCTCGDRCGVDDPEECSAADVCVGYDFDSHRGVCVEREFAERHGDDVKVLGQEDNGDNGGDSECDDDTDCAGDDICDDGECVDDNGGMGCNENDECGDDEVCEGGICVDDDDETPECQITGDCEDDEFCDDGECVDDPSCQEHRDCSTDEVCDRSIGECRYVDYDDDGAMLLCDEHCHLVETGCGQDIDDNCAEQCSTTVDDPPAGQKEECENAHRTALTCELREIERELEEEGECLPASESDCAEKRDDISAACFGP